MLIAEALAERKDILKRIAEYPAKVAEIAVWDEDDEKPKKAEYDDLVASVAADLLRVEHITLAINEANAKLEVNTEWGRMSIMQAIARRDQLVRAQRAASQAQSAVEGALLGNRWERTRRSKEDIKRNSLVAPRELSRTEDALAGQIRRLDLAIQQVNWTAEVSI